MVDRQTHALSTRDLQRIITACSNHTNGTRLQESMEKTALVKGRSE